MCPLRQATRPPPPNNLKRALFWFVLGREPLLSAAELAAVLNLDKTGFKLTGNLLKVKLSAIDAPALISRLGGTIKICRELGADLTEEEIIEEMTEELKTVDGKIQFGISLCEKEQRAKSKEQLNESISKVEDLGKEIKKRLKAGARSVRFVFNNETELSSVSVEKNGLTKRGREFVITGNGGGAYNLAKTLSVQPFEEWGKRDFGRPGRDDVSGMLPPKLALMMLNIGINNKQLKINNDQPTILDPFCGSGTILTEAALLGYPTLIGSDLSDKAIVDTQNNINWLTQQNLKSKIINLKLFVSDIRDLPNHLPSHSVDTIATEPYLGPPLKGNESLEQIKKNCTKLADLYKAAFVNFKKVMKPGGVVVFLIPRFFMQGKWHTISDKIMADLKLLGFEKQRLLPKELSEPYYLVYHRPGQYVGREVWKFKLK